MWIIPCALVLGLLAGLALARGNLAALRSVRLRFWPLAIPAAIAGIAAGLSLGITGATILLGVSLLGFGLFLGANLDRPGAAIVLLGIILNLAPLILNSHIPVRHDAVVAAGIVSADAIDRVELGSGREFETSKTQLGILGGVLPVKPLGEVLSFGDLVVMAGLLNLGFRLTHPGPVRRALTRSGSETSSDDDSVYGDDELVIDLDALAAIPPRHTPGLTPRPGTRTLEGSAPFGPQAAFR